MGNSRRLRRGLTAGVVVAGVGGLVAAGLGTAQAATGAEGQVLSAGTANAVQDSYIVKLKDNALTDVASTVSTAVDTLATDLAGDYGAKVTNTFDSALHGFVIHASEAQAKRLAANGDVAYVEQNQRVHTADTQKSPPSWGLDRIDQAELPLDDAYNYSTTADNVTAYVIDTGVQADHPTFGDRVKKGHDAVDGDDDANDENGHGTHVAGTIGGKEYGVAKGVNIVPVRVLDANGSGTTEQVVEGIDWVAENHDGPSVANMSLGGGADQSLDDAVKGAIDSGVTFGVAAGNESADAGQSSPARVESAITVAASGQKDGQADFSNYGSVVDLYAPGVDIVSSYMGGGEETLSGTSMATPHVVGAAALYLADNPDAAPADVETGLTDAATPDVITNPTGDTPNLLLNTGQKQ